MPCFSPNIILQYEDGSIKFLGSINKVVGDPHFEKRTLDYDKMHNCKRLLVPCGHCVGCRIDYSKQWANRCFLESQQFDSNYFITLTYDDVYLPFSDSGLPTLKADHLKKFIKDLREFYRMHFNHTNIRFFACGEYGDKSFRPHYHILFFNLPILDLSTDFINSAGDIIHKNDINGDPYYSSKILSDIWKKGHVIIGRVSWNSSAYVARYIFKKYNGEYDIYKKLDVESVFVRMSRRPGIGSWYFDKNFNMIYLTDKLYLSNNNGAFIAAPGLYFDRKLKLTDPFLYDKVKAVREYNNNIRYYKNFKCDPLSFKNRLLVNKNNLISKLKALQRL